MARSCAIGTASTVCASPPAKTRPPSVSTPAGGGPLAHADGDARRARAAARRRPRATPRAGSCSSGVPAKRGWWGRSPGSASSRGPGRASTGEVTATRSASQTAESRVNSRLGSGGTTKSCRSHPEDQPLRAQAAPRQLLVGQPGHQGAGQVVAGAGRRAARRRLRAGPAQPGVERGGDRLVARRRERERLGEQVARGRAPPRRGRAGPRRTRRAPPAPGPPRAARRRAGRPRCGA